MAINFPDSPSVDEIYSVGDKSWLWNGTYWEVQGAPSSTFSASDTAPAEPDAGDIWYRSDTSQTLLFYDNTWVEIGHSANVPTYFADNDGDTKIQVEESADEDTIRFDTAGSERVTIGPSGDVVVYETLTVNGGASVGGSVIPTGNETLDLGSAEYRFRDLYLSGSSIDLGGATISSDGTSIAMPPISNIEGDLTVGTDVLHVDHATSSVGIGTTTPDSLLEIKSPRSELKISSSEGDPLTNHSGRILFENTNTGDTYDAAAIEIHGSTDAARNGSITFLTNPDGLGSPNGLLERMVIDELGNVGIGTDAPEHVLHLKSLGDAGIHIQADSDNSGESDNPYISFSQDGSTAQQFKIGMNGGADEAFTGAIANSPFIHAANAASQPLQLAHNGSVVMTLDSGNVGIGVTDPSSTLEIVSTDVDTLYLRTSTNGVGTRIKWTDNGSESQHGYLKYVHSDSQSYGHGNAFIFDSTESTMTVVSTDDFTAVGTLTQNYSDERLKTIHGTIPNALEKLSGIRGYLYTQNETADLLGFKEVGVQQVGVSAQEVMAVLPQVVTIAPISYTDKTEEEYYTVRYERMIPLLIETIHELTARIEALEAG